MPDRKSKPLTATGNCFENCGRYMTQHADEDTVLVHAIVTGAQGSDVEGIEFSHAFLLVADSLAVDMTRGNPEHDPEKMVTMFIGQYRDYGNVRDERHYTRDEVLAMLRKHEHWGPWTDELQTDADREASSSAEGTR